MPDTTQEGGSPISQGDIGEGEKKQKAFLLFFALQKSSLFSKCPDTSIALQAEVICISVSCTENYLSSIKQVV